MTYYMVLPHPFGPNNLKFTERNRRIYVEHTFPLNIYDRVQIEHRIGFMDTDNYDRLNYVESRESNGLYKTQWDIVSIHDRSY